MFRQSKYRFLVSLLLALAFGYASAQNQPCRTGDKMIPIGVSGEVDQQRIHGNMNLLKNANKTSDTLIFPVVVHIFYDSIWGNIADSQVVDGLRIINEDFNRMNADTSVTSAVFKPFAAAVGFKFMLAKLDSNGDSTSGIVRIDTTIFPHPDPPDPDFNNVKFISHWPSHMYYNIWLVRGIQGGTLGYAQYPGTNFTYGGPWATWGIVVRSDQWGTIGTSSVDGRTGTHEVGHTFGLYHTFLSLSASCGNVCDTTGDEVCDTPPAKYSGACSQVNTCGNDTSGSSPYMSGTVDQIENYMSYNSCQNMFSEGQKVRMRGFIASFDTLVGLSSDANLIATGLMQPISIDDQSEEALKSMFIYPNPGSGLYTVEINMLDSEPLHITVCNMLGQEILHLNVPRNKGLNKYTLDLSAYPAGLYNVTLVTKDEVSSKKVIKE